MNIVGPPIVTKKFLKTRASGRVLDAQKVDEESFSKEGIAYAVGCVGLAPSINNSLTVEVLSVVIQVIQLRVLRSSERSSLAQGSDFLSTITQKVSYSWNHCTYRC